MKKKINKVIEPNKETIEKINEFLKNNPEISGDRIYMSVNQMTQEQKLYVTIPIEDYKGK